MNEPPLTDEEIIVLRRIIHTEEGRMWFRTVLRERLKMWGIWIALVTAAVGGLRSIVSDYFVGKH